MNFRNDAIQGAGGFLMSNLNYIEREVYRREYTVPMYKEVFAPGAIDMSAGEWARSIEVYSMDVVGAGKFLSGNARDVPIVDVGYQRQVQAIEAAGIGYRYTIEELQTLQAAARERGIPPSQAINADRAMVCRETFEQHVDNVALNGDSEISFPGWTANSNVPRANVVNGAGGTATWETKTPDEILFDINDAISDVWDQTKNVDLPGHIAIPSSSFSYIAHRRLGSVNDTTVLEYIKTRNAFTARTNQPIQFHPLIHLEDAGNSDTKRMAVYNQVAHKQKMHMPMALRFLQPQLMGFEYMVPGMYRLGPAEWRYPLSGVYRDGI